MPERDPQRSLYGAPSGPPPGEVPQYSYAWVPYVLGGIAALALAIVITRLNYGYAQAPHRIVKMILGASFLAFTVFRPKLALHLWLLAMPVAAWLPVTGIPGLNGVNLLFIVALVGWVGPWFMSGQRLLPRTRIGPALAFYIVVLFASVIRTILFPPEGTEFGPTELLLRVWQRVPALAIYYVAVGSTRDYDRIRSLIGTFAVSTGIAALIAFRQFATTPDVRRVGGGMNPNDFAAYVGMCATALIAHVFTSSAFTRTRRLVLWVAAGLASIAVLLPKSRGGYVGFAGGLSAVTFLMSKKAFIVFLLVLIASPLWAPGFVKDRVLETEVESMEAQISGDVTDRLDPSAAVRIEVWRIVLSEVAARPVFGFGFGSVPMLTLDRMGTPFSAHSLYFETLADMGLIGVAALAWLLVACTRSGFELARRATTPLTRGLAVGFIAATVVLLLTNVFGQRFLHRSIAGSYFVLAGMVDRSVLLEKDAAAHRHEEGMAS
ncbi:MAG: O-antigen ligase family protein [Candidatus Eisenbacteria bacterium]